MLQKLNERIQGVVAWLVIILIAITFTLFGVDYYLQSHHSSDVKALVNDQPLTNQAFETNYRRARAQQDASHLTAADEKQLKNQVLEQMITNEVAMQSAHQYGFDVTPNQADGAIVNIPQFQEDGHFSTERYQQALSGALFTPDTFQKEVRQGMLLNQQRFAFMGSSFALPDEVSKFVSLYMQTRDYDYLTVSAAAFQKQVTVTAKDIKKYYIAHQKEFMTPEQVSLDYVTLSMQGLREKIAISKDDIAHYYTENQSNYLTPAQWRVAHILFAVPEGASDTDVQLAQKKAETTYEALEKNPEQFNQYVQSSSDDKLSLAEKGKLPWLTAGLTDYDKILAGLTTPGQISAPEKTKHGYEIFKLIAYKPTATKPLSEVESTIKEQLIAEKTQADYAHALEQLTDLSYQAPDSLQPVSEALKLKIQTTEPFSRQGNSNPLTRNSQLINAAFSHDVIELGNNSEPIQIDNDSVLVIRAKQHYPTKQQTLDVAKAQIEKRLTKEFADEKAKAVGTTLLATLSKETSSTRLAQNKQQESNSYKWQKVAKAPRDNDKADSLINDLAFTLAKPGSHDGLSLPNGDYVLVRLKQINNGTLATLDNEHKNSLIQQIEASYGVMDYDLYINQLIKKANIVRNN